MEWAPLCVPVEIRRADLPPQKRWFRLGLELASDRLRLRSPLPEELCGPPLHVRLRLPPPTAQAETLGEDYENRLSLFAQAGELVVNVGSDRERAEPLLLLFRRLTEEQREILESYISLRLLSDE